MIAGSVYDILTKYTEKDNIGSFRKLHTDLIQFLGYPSSAKEFIIALTYKGYLDNILDVSLEDDYYPKDCTIRIILDNHSAHISKETMSYLATRPNRFSYVRTPKHGSWLNLVETFFSKISRTFLRRIRVESKQELKDRILLGIQEINAEPVVHCWKKFDFAKNNT